MSERWQDGAAKRLVKASSGQDIYRAINVLVQYYSQPCYHFRVPRTVFFPRPQVDAAMTTFALRPGHQRPLPPDAEANFEAFISTAFRTKRKRLRNVLQPAHSAQSVEAGLQAVGLAANARAVDLSSSQYVDLYSRMKAQ